MDGCDGALDNVFVKRLWRSLKYEETYRWEYEGRALETTDGISPATWTSITTIGLTPRSKAEPILKSTKPVDKRRPH